MPIIVMERSIHQPDLFTSCNRLAQTDMLGMKVIKFQNASTNPVEFSSSEVPKTISTKMLKTPTNNQTEQTTSIPIEMPDP